MDELIVTALGHMDFGDPECCGCLYGRREGGRAEIVCNECGAVVRTTAAGELQKTLIEMQLELDVCNVQCQHCGSINLFPAVTRMIAFRCKSCDGFNAQVASE